MNKTIQKLFVADESQLPEIQANEMFFIVYITPARVFFSIIDQKLVDKERKNLVDDLLPVVALSTSTFRLSNEQQDDGRSKYAIDQILEKDLPTSGLLENAIPVTIDQRGFLHIEDIILYAKELILQVMIETLKKTISEHSGTEEAETSISLLPLYTRVHGLLTNYRESDSQELKDGYIHALEIILNESTQAIWPST